MIDFLGHASLSGAVLAAASVVLLGLLAHRDAARAEWAARWTRLSRWMLVVVAVALTTSMGTLLAALLNDQFQYDYVASYSERAMLGGYKFAALWAGQAGSLLLWAWMLAALSAIAAFGWRRHASESANSPDGRPGSEFALANACLGLVNVFFAVIILFAANPFDRVVGEIPFDGRGLNPQLQDLAMIIHPPLLFVGYAGYAIPFAALVGVLIAKPGDNRWLGAIRRWILFSWVFLGAGILMGAWWAYIELGWGGYWAWDPVENASLLPWLTSTALLHSLLVQQHRGMFKFWNAGLIASTFLLCIFGTYITRSGVIQSVHAFAESLIGVFFLVFLAILTAISVGLVAWRRKALAPQRPLDGLISREGAILGGNVLLTIMTGVTLLGTIFPLIGPFIGAADVAVKAAFYNRVVAPMGIALVGIMALAPVLAFGQQAAQRILHSARWPAAAAFVVTAAVAFFLTRNVWALLCVAIAALGTGAVIVDYLRSVAARRRSTGEGLIAAACTLVDRDHRRYGGQLAHLGLMLIVIGVAGSSLFSTESTHKVRPGDTFEEAGFAMRFDGITDRRGENYHAVEASVQLTDSRGVVSSITPEVRFYDKWSEQPNAEIALRSTVTEDLYITLAGWEAGGTIAAIQVRVNPAVLWIWIGGIIMVVGGSFAMLPKLLPLVGVARRRESHAAGERGPVAPLGVAPALRASTSVLALVATTLLCQSTWAQAPGQGGIPWPTKGSTTGQGDGAAADPNAKGTLSVRVVQGTPGEPAIGVIPVSVELFHRGMLLDTINTQTDEHGVVIVENVAIGQPVRPVARVKFQDLDYQVAGGTLDAQHPNQKLDVVCYASTEEPPEWKVKTRHMMVVPEGDGVRVTEAMLVENPGAKTWVGVLGSLPKRTTTAFALPNGASDVQLGRGFHKWCCSTIVGGQLVNHLPLMPEESEMVFSYYMPATNGTVALDVVATSPVDATTIMTPTSIQSGVLQGLTFGGEQTMGDTTARIYAASAMARGAKASVSFVNLASATVPAAMPAAAPTATPASAPALDANSGQAAKLIAAIGGGAILLIAAILLLRRKGSARATVGAS